MEVTAEMIDRLATVEIRWGGRHARGVIPKLYEYAREKAGGKPLSLVAAQRLTEKVKPRDHVFLVTGWACLPFLPRGETDGPLGIASLARAVSIGLGALPIIVVGSKQMGPTCATVNAAELTVLDYEEARSTSGAVAAAIAFPTLGRERKEESRKFAAEILDRYNPTAVVSVETGGPNEKGICHTSSGYDIEASGDRLPSLEYLFLEASARGILTIGIIDSGNEIGSGTVEEYLKQVIPYGSICQCPCGSGIVNAVKTDITYPASVSNWGAYAVTAMVAYLLKKPEILHDAYMERQMLEAGVRAGSFDALHGRACMSEDGIDYLTCEAVVTVLKGILENSLKGLKDDRFKDK